MTYKNWQKCLRQSRSKNQDVVALNLPIYSLFMSYTFFYGTMRGWSIWYFSIKPVFLSKENKTGSAVNSEIYCKDV